MTPGPITLRKRLSGSGVRRGAVEGNQFHRQGVCVGFVCEWKWIAPVET